MGFSFQSLIVPEVILIKPEVFNDSRGFFLEAYQYQSFHNNGINDVFVQDNHSKSDRKGVIRGLHFQAAPMAQAKLVRVIAGSIFDVAVDIRVGSPTYRQSVSQVLSSENKEMLYIPVGFAHGFCVLEENTEVIYKCSNVYSKEHDRGVFFNDQDIAINWPVKNPQLSEKDKSWPLLKELEVFFKYE